MSALSIKAGCAGVFAGLLGSLLASALWGLLLGVPLTTDSLSGPEWAGDLILSLFCVTGGGYLAGIFGRQNPELNATASGAAQLILLAITYLATEPRSPRWYEGAAFILMIPAAYLGGRIARRRP
jgi:hypothetical protein